MIKQPDYIDDPAFARFIEDQKDRLQKLREQNDSDMSAEETAKLRGQISEIKRVIRMTEPQPEFVSASNIV
jgi:hypothetical protein